ncbi:MAG: hypothetical protein ACYSTS_00830 [Planctomycetota bacterium]|jgi:hypothetical protein
MQKKMGKVPIEDNSDASIIFDLLKRETGKNIKTKVIFKKNDQVSKDFLMYHSINKL